MTRSVALLAFALWSSACGGDPAALRPAATGEEALRRGLEYLARHQGADGGWHSEHYGVLRVGYSLTAYSLHVLSKLTPELREPYAEVVERAFEFLAAGTDEDGAVGLKAHSVDYPNYTSAYYLSALTSLRPPGWRELADRQIAQLRRVQLYEAQGWTANDACYGGYSFGGRPQQKPLGADLLNLSVTTAAVEALRAGGLPAYDPTVARALVFVQRCQTFVKADPLRDPSGGFVFSTLAGVGISKAATPDDPTRGYGSMTCDGLRALLGCGLKSDHLRVQAARAWLQRHLRIDRVPGFESDSPFEPALRMYYLSSLAQTARWLQVSSVQRGAIREQLLARQRVDGAFVGFSPLMKEDDPLVATPLAMLGIAATESP